MAMLRTTLLTLSAIGSAHAYVTTAYLIGLPNKVEGRSYEVREKIDESDYLWEDLNPDIGSFEIGGPYSADAVGLRIKGEDSTAVVFKYDESLPEALQLNVENEGSYGASARWYHSITVEFAETPTNGSARRDFWEEADYTPLPFTSPTISIGNSMCGPTSFQFTLTSGPNDEIVSDLDQELSEESYVQITIPDSFPVKGNATFGDGTELTFVLNEADRVVWAKASDGPSVSASYDVSIQYCPD